MIFQMISNYCKVNNLSFLDFLKLISKNPSFFLKKFSKRIKNIILYKKWIKNYETEIGPEFKILNNTPLLSVVIPTYNTDPIFLRECLNSVLEQSYSNFEICISDDNSTNKSTIDILNAFSREEKIKIHFRKTNGGISENTNSAISICSGDFILFLDHDDKLSINALYEVAKAIIENPNKKFIYSDEDLIDERGRRSHPNFKSDFNEYLLYSQNYICHLVAVDSNLVRKVGGLRKGYDGSQDHDFILRCYRNLNDEQIFHIPKILYHWRMHGNSFHKENLVKCQNSSLLALGDFFKSKGLEVKAQVGLSSLTYKINFITKKDPIISLILFTKDEINPLKICIKSVLEKTDFLNYEIIIIDNNSEEEETLNYFNEISKIPNIRILEFKNPFNYSAIINFAAKRAKGEILAIVDKFIEVISPNWLKEMASYFVDQKIGIVGAKLYYPNQTIKHAGLIIGLTGLGRNCFDGFYKDDTGYCGRLISVQNLSAVSGACFLIRKNVFLEVGGLDEKDLPTIYNDIDLCLKVLETGHKVLWTPFAELCQHKSLAQGYEDTAKIINRSQKELDTFKTRWIKFINRDPAYNPNLSLEKLDFSIKA